MKIDMLINGEPIGATGGATFTRNDPVTGAAATTAPAATVADAVAAAGDQHHFALKHAHLSFLLRLSCP